MSSRSLHSDRVPTRPRTFTNNFRLADHSDAQSVEVYIEGLGQGNSWLSVPMTRGVDGVWTATVSLPIKTHHYLFVLNGDTPILDPMASTTKHSQCDNVSVLFSRGT